jgi:hypothetical protein
MDECEPRSFPRETRQTSGHVSCDRGNVAVELKRPEIAASAGLQVRVEIEHGAGQHVIVSVKLRFTRTPPRRARFDPSRTSDQSPPRPAGDHIPTLCFPSKTPCLRRQESQHRPASDDIAVCYEEIRVESVVGPYATYPLPRGSDSWNIRSRSL